MQFFEKRNSVQALQLEVILRGKFQIYSQIMKTKYRFVLGVSHLAVAHICSVGTFKSRYLSPGMFPILG